MSWLRETLDLPSTGQTALTALGVLGMGLVWRFFAFLADRVPKDLERFWWLLQFPWYRQTPDYAKMQSDPRAKLVVKLMRTFAFWVVLPMSWLMMIGGVAFLLLSSIEEFLI